MRQTPTRNEAALAPEPNRLTNMMHASVFGSPVTLTLLLLNLLVFAITLAYGAGLWHTNNGVQLQWGASFGPATQDGQWWRLATAMFLHFGLVHLVLNMWALWDVGRLMEALLGRLRFAALYLGAGVAGNLLSLVVQGNQAVSGGASGAIFSLYGALLVFLWRERRQVDRGEFRWQQAVELHRIVSGQVSGRPTADAITLFESQGIGIEDVAAMSYVLRKARTAEVGVQLPF